MSDLSMALKMLYRGPSSRLETLIEKIQQNNKETSPNGKLHLKLLIFSRCIHLALDLIVRYFSTFVRKRNENKSN